MLFYAFSLKMVKVFPRNKKIERSQDAKNMKGLQRLSSYSASVIENVHYILTPFPLSSYSLDCPETRKVNIQSRSKKPVFSPNYSLQLTRKLTYL